MLLLHLQFLFMFMYSHQGLLISIISSKARSDVWKKQNFRCMKNRSSTASVFLTPHRNLVLQKFIPCSLQTIQLLQVLLSYLGLTNCLNHHQWKLFLPSPLCSLYSSEHNKLSDAELKVLYEKIFSEIEVAEEEAEFLQEATQLQSQSLVWYMYEHRKGCITASNFQDVYHKGEW